MVQRLLQKIPVVAITVPTNFDIVGLRELLTNYRVHHYKLRKMHLIVCSHNPQKKHENQEVKIPYTEILTNKKENKTNQVVNQQGVNQQDGSQKIENQQESSEQSGSQQGNPVANKNIKPSYTSILKRHKK